MQSRPGPDQSVPKARSRGFEEPNYTQVPNDLMDRWLPELSCAELKVLLYLMRSTFGFHRDRHAAGLRRICDSTGLHVETVADAVKRLRARGLLSYERRLGRRSIYTLRFTKEVYGKSEHPCSEKPNTEVYGKSEHVERNSSSSETKPKKENYTGRVGKQTGGAAKDRSASSPFQSKRDDDENLQTRESYATPEDELRAVYRIKTGQEISRDLLNRISDTCELRGVPLSRYVEELRPHIPNTWKNPGGFLTDFARKFKSKVSCSITFQLAKVEHITKESPRCAKCRGIGRVDDGYCDCQMGMDLKRVEHRATAQPVSPDPGLSGTGRTDK